MSDFHYYNDNLGYTLLEEEIDRLAVGMLVRSHIRGTLELFEIIDKELDNGVQGGIGFTIKHAYEECPLCHHKFPHSHIYCCGVWLIPIGAIQVEKPRP